MEEHIFSLQRRKGSRLAILWVKEFEKLWSMTRYLKLVRTEDGKWEALPTETDDLAQAPHIERTYVSIETSELNRNYVVGKKQLMQHILKMLFSADFLGSIDPAQLLKALDSLLSKDGGIKSIEDVPRLARSFFYWVVLNELASCSSYIRLL
ncbi:hypothetical protein CEXT_404282 [Caerostris extrusa]|uniref:Uncharacterized protein n=1 Tax=Caerostris extrusa TaxID=172846 RepID=A0AAV4YDV1_CAEEX|nr:hypothetical protein CEXT_404282 [Caerostris extrusa]